MNLIQLWNINGIELIKRCSTMPLYIGRYLKSKMVKEKTAVFPQTKNFPLRTAVHIFIVTNRISFRKIKIDEWASYYKLIRNVHPWQETVTVQTIYIFLTFTSTFTFSHNGAFLQQIVMNYNKFYLLVLCTWQLIQFQASVWDLILHPASDLVLVKSVQHTTLFWSQHFVCTKEEMSYLTYINFNAWVPLLQSRGILKSNKKSSQISSSVICTK